MLPTDAEGRKATPICTGALDYFPDALAEVARCSKVGNDQHNPGQPLHWDKSKSTDEADCLVRHLLQRGTRDTDGVRHTAKVAWRALALLQRELEAEQTAAAAAVVHELCCCHCGRTLRGELHFGAGDGRGQRFACAPCYFGDTAGYAERRGGTAGAHEESQQP